MLHDKLLLNDDAGARDFHQAIDDVGKSCPSARKRKVYMRCIYVSAPMFVDVFDEPFKEKRWFIQIYVVDVVL